MDNNAQQLTNSSTTPTLHQISSLKFIPISNTGLSKMKKTANSNPKPFSKQKTTEMKSLSKKSWLTKKN